MPELVRSSSIPPARRPASTAHLALRLVPLALVPGAVSLVAGLAAGPRSPLFVGLGALGASAAALLVAALLLRGPLAATRAALAAHEAAEAGVRQRERLLAAVVESASTAMVLYGDLGRVVFSNPGARALFAEGAPLDGMNFLELLSAAPAPLREAALSEGDALFTVEQPGGAETFRLARRTLQLDGEPHTLLLVERITRELSRQEAARWKRVIRVLCHELNNSLAPISSLVHTTRVIVKNPARADRLTAALDTIEGRVAHLRMFVEGYADFARLPAPRPATVPWSDFVARFATLYPQAHVAPPPPGEGWLDAAQIEQAVTNLLKNALESGSPPEAVELLVSPREHGGAHITVRDGGPGMSSEVMAQALLPFFSTKEGGTGLGLPLCREIAEAHGGTLDIARREGGGLAVTLSLPGRAPPVSVATVARLTLTRP